MATTGAGTGVRWAGALRSVLAGDLGSHVSLERLGGLAHLYAVGPVAGLRGEITIVDGQPYVSRVEDGRIVVDRSLRHDAACLVWAQVARWHDVCPIRATPPAPGANRIRHRYEMSYLLARYFVW